MFFKQLGFAHLLIGSLLLQAFPVQAAEPGIVGPDGPRGIRPSQVPRTPSNNLRLWLEKRREEKRNEEGQDNPVEVGKDRAETLAQKSERAAPEEARVRWDLQLVLPALLENGQRDASWSPEPGAAMSFYGRVGDTSVWVGFRLLAFSGSATVDAKSSRFAWTYFGPAVAREWLTVTDEAEGTKSETSRHRLAGGLALASRQGEAEVAQPPAELATKSVGFDGPGLWMEYSYGNAWSIQSEWQLSGGLQILKNKTLFYAGAGISLWDAW